MHILHACAVLALSSVSLLFIRLRPFFRSSDFRGVRVASRLQPLTLLEFTCFIPLNRPQSNGVKLRFEAAWAKVALGTMKARLQRYPR